MPLYGFHNLQDMAQARVTGTLIEAANDAINAAVAQHNADINSALAIFAEPTTLHTERYAQISNVSLQPLDDSGRALPIKPSGYYSVAYPIRAGGGAWGADYVTKVKMTIADVERATAQMLTADANFVRGQMLAALFAFQTTTFVDPLYGSLTVQPFALTADGVTYPFVSGSPATDQHFLGQANAIGAGADNPYPTIYTELTEHPTNQGKPVVFIASSLVATTRALATFTPVADANLQPGSGTDVLVGNLGVAHPGTLIGYEDSGIWIVEWPMLPSGYMIATTTEGDRPLGKREDPETELQGFVRVAERDDHPFYESQWLRRIGFGARNRIGAFMVRIGNGTYDEPSGYTPPI